MKIIASAAALLLAASLSAQAQSFWQEGRIFRKKPSAPESERTSDAEEERPKPTFREIDMVPLARGVPTYEIGLDVHPATARRRLRPFLLNRYETAYRLWHEVRIASEKDGYRFANPGQEGSFGRRGAAPTGRNGVQPVTNISWHDAVVWCNALSEREGLSPCYTYNGRVLRDSTKTAECDLAVCDWNANGYRLPTEAEWEYAARLAKDKIQPGDAASGASLYGGPQDFGAVAWTSENSDATHPVGTAGTAPDGGVPAAGSGNANGAGLFDMSGNVLEYCWDWFSDYIAQKDGEVAQGPEYGLRRVSRGGSWSPYTPFFFAADRYSFDPNEFYQYMGFRLCRNFSIDIE